MPRRRARSGTGCWNCSCASSLVPERPESVLRVLAEALGADTDATSIADALWLAAAAASNRSGPTDKARAPVPAADPAGAHQGTGHEQEEASAPRARHPKPDAADPDAADTTSLGLYERLPGARSAPGTPVTVAPGRSLPQSMALGRALRPFKRRYQHGSRQDLDLDATLRDYGRSGELVPVFGPTPEPWFDVLLVVDTAPSMDLWKRTVGEFTSLLAGSGVFRQVHTWRLTAGPQLTDHQGRPAAPGRALSSDVRRLILVVSDCSSADWRDAGVWQLLRRWGAATPTVLLNPLPGRLWHQTALDLPAVRVTQRGPGLRNTELDYRAPLLPRTQEGPGADWLALPTLAFTPHSIGRWARVFMRGAPHGCDAVLIPRSGRLASPFAAPAAPAGRSGPTESFLHTASPPAVRLAMLCSPFSRLSLDLVQLLRQELVPEATTGDLAELLTSSLVGLATPTDGEPSVITFDPAARDRLAADLGRRDALHALDTLSRYVARRRPAAGPGIEATAVPDGEPLPEDLAPFARASAELLLLLRTGTVVPLPPESQPPAPAPPAALLREEPRLPVSHRSAALLFDAEPSRHAPAGPRTPRAAVHLRDLLMSDVGWRLPEDRCTALPTPGELQRVVRLIEERCRSADDSLVLYVGGHGRPVDLEPVGRTLGASGPVYAVVLLDQGDGRQGAELLMSSWQAEVAKRALMPGFRQPTLEVAFTDGAVKSGAAEALLRAAREGVPDGPPYLDLHTVISESRRYGDQSLVLLQSLGSSKRVWVRNVCYVQPAPSALGAEIATVYAELWERLRDHLPQHGNKSHENAVESLLRALLVFAAEWAHKNLVVRTLSELAKNVHESLQGQGIEIQHERAVGGRARNLVWDIGDAYLNVTVSRRSRRQRAPARPQRLFDSPVAFCLILEPERELRGVPLSRRASVREADGGPGADAGCEVILTVPGAPAESPFPPQTGAEPLMTTSDLEAEFHRDTLPRAVEAACENLRDVPLGEGQRAAFGTEVEQLTIALAAPALDQIDWRPSGAYETGLAGGKVFVAARLVLEGALERTALPLADSNVEVVDDAWGEDTVWVSVERDAVLVFEAERDLVTSDVDLEFSTAEFRQPSGLPSAE
ncbi:SAV_2336 N-terminal domain-related protein [Streptomyces sp. PRh5]|uniref:SAV_2336 N-terminal domain-related protein n=1 Tax=Streptomyces sp. PRh5 TaxID=1158056 RepID=UPI00240EF6EC|nr:SAV_2336 N-terminal domain-related protein [Streptomyces sp. PRh5]